MPSSSQQPQTLVLVNDSLSAFQILQNMTATNCILQTLFTVAQTEAIFLWVPSHCDIRGTELADTAAKQAAI